MQAAGVWWRTFRSVADTGCACLQAVLVFDVTSRKSFESLDNWYREAVRFGPKDVLVVVCGNKVGASRRRGACLSGWFADADPRALGGVRVRVRVRVTDRFAGSRGVGEGGAGLGAIAQFPLL